MDTVLAGLPHVVCYLDIAHLTSAFRNPSSKGQVERVAQILKTALKQAKRTNTPVDYTISSYLLSYRSSPHSATGESPSILLMGRKIRTRLINMLPSLRHKMARSLQNTLARTVHRSVRCSNAGGQVKLLNFGKGDKCHSGSVAEALGSRHYLVSVQGKVIKRHVYQVLSHEPLTDFADRLIVC